ncbi:MAG: phage virion morphogenesis protein [Oceanospirillaceae bacterium]|nr:phage virion morphogenesis protein [Oceanospirillaceae bacterium]
MDDLSRLENWVEPLLQQITPAARKHLAKTIGTSLRRSQQQRIKAQQNPGGTRFAPRRAQQKSGAIKRKAMFLKLKRAKYFKVKASADKLSVGFFGRVARIAQVHQQGLRDKAHKNSREIRYKKRKLLGFSDRDKNLIMDGLLDHLSD